MQDRTYLALSTALRPALALPFPGRWRLFGRWVNNCAVEGHWRHAGLRWTRCKNTGLTLPCDLNTFSGRITWYFHRWYEIDTQSLILTLLPPDGTFIDIGGNVGMASLSAAAALGTRGRIIAFEPNPAVAAIHAEAVRRNRLTDQHTLHMCAVGTQPGTTQMFVPDVNHGEGSLASGPQNRPGRMVDVSITDARSLEELPRIDLVKIDVEGYELTVLKALERALARHRPPVICELMDQHLAFTGIGTADVIAHMHALDYVPLLVSYENAGLLRQRATLRPLEITPGTTVSCNALFVPRERADDYLALRCRPLLK